MKHLEENHLGNNTYNLTGRKVSAGQHFEWEMRKEDPCKYCGTNDNSKMYFFIQEDNAVVCFDCVGKEAWKKKK